MIQCKNPAHQARRFPPAVIRVEVLNERNVPADARSTALTGDGCGTYTAANNYPDGGRVHVLDGMATLDGLGEANLTGTIQGVGFVRFGNAGGTLELTKGQSVLKLVLSGAEQPGFAALPSAFQYRVLSATGEYVGKNGTGTMTLTLYGNNGWYATFGGGDPLQDADTSPDLRVANEIETLYHAYLRREADAEGRECWVAARKAGISFREISEAMLTSEEYVEARPNLATYVRSLYYDVLGRAGTDEEVAAWVEAAKAGLGRGGLAARFLDSVEAIGRTVDGYYLNYLGRDADVPSRAAWVEMIRLGIVTQENAADFFRNSTECQAKRGMQDSDAS